MHNLVVYIHLSMTGTDRELRGTDGYVMVGIMVVLYNLSLLFWLRP